MTGQVGILTKRHPDRVRGGRDAFKHERENIGAKTAVEIQIELT